MFIALRMNGTNSLSVYCTVATEYSFISILCLTNLYVALYFIIPKQAIRKQEGEMDLNSHLDSADTGKWIITFTFFQALENFHFSISLIPI